MIDETPYPEIRLLGPEEAASPASRARRARVEFRERILAELDIVAVMRDYTPLHRAGRYFCGKCRFHADAAESLWVDPQRAIFKCRTCGAGGTLIDFVQRLLRLDDEAATAYLADLAGIPG